MQRLRWLFSNWQISYVLALLLLVSYLDTDGNVQQILALAIANHDYLVAGVIAELIVRRKLWISVKATIPK
ncbi:MAG: hypothetical protein MUF19_00200 [Candidatus Pacebacteria bacterium]|jgi:hypothetical protein|nr:hypothetical protein [Candidatus Paceibacterota bacterium]